MSFLIVSGSGYYPWNKNVRKLHILLRMCIIYNKKTLLLGNSMLDIVYLAATNFQHWTEIYKMSLSGEQHSNAYELDQCTGDLF